MIDDKIREFIESYLKLHMDRDDWKYIEDMFSEVYLTHEDGIDIITLKPTPNGGETAIQFSAINGAYVSIDEWNRVKQKGKKL